MNGVTAAEVSHDKLCNILTSAKSITKKSGTTDKISTVNNISTVVTQHDDTLMVIDSGLTPVVIIGQQETIHRYI